jgi:hypothetical protein
MKQRQIGGDTLAHLLLMTTAAMWVSNWWLSSFPFGLSIFFV